MLPRQAQRSGTGQSTLLASQGEKIREATPAFYLPAEDRYMQAADVQGTYMAGENLDTLYITTAGGTPDSRLRQDYPLSGSLFVCKPGVYGVKACFFYKKN